jgi:hypothetical protein
MRQFALPRQRKRRRGRQVMERPMILPIAMHASTEAKVWTASVLLGAFCFLGKASIASATRSVGCCGYSPRLAYLITETQFLFKAHGSKMWLE